MEVQIRCPFHNEIETIEFPDSYSSNQERVFETQCGTENPLPIRNLIIKMWGSKVIGLGTVERA